jgi:ribulose-phosphate 3-epimerase
MALIVPALLPKSRAELVSGLMRLAPLEQVTEVQIDLVDGEFATPASWPYALGESWELPFADRFLFDIDLMVHDPRVAIDAMVSFGARRVTVHAESTPRIHELLADLRKTYGHEAGFAPDLLAVGIALGVETPVTLIDSFVGDIDYVELMGIATIGRQGEPFDARVLSRIRELHTKYPSLTIQIDGAVSLETAPKLLAAGASRLVVGSALTRADSLVERLDAFLSIGEKYGAYER